MSVKFDFKSLDQGFEADWPVTVNAPIDGGKIQERTFMARFRTPRPEEREALKEIQNANDRLEKALEFGFIGLAKSEGEALTADLKAALWSEQIVRIALINAYVGFQTGTPAKN